MSEKSKEFDDSMFSKGLTVNNESDRSIYRGNKLLN